MTFLPTTKSETILFSRSSKKKKILPSRMTFLAVKFEARIFLRLALALRQIYQTQTVVL